LTIKKQQGGISLDSALGAVAQNQYPWTNPDKRVSHRQVLGRLQELAALSGVPGYRRGRRWDGFCSRPV
jgi:hypothetical protein